MTTISLIALLGGLALFIYGVNLMSRGMQRLAGAKLRTLMGVVVRHRSAGLIMGLALTFLLQSSSASTVMFVSLVQGGILVFRDTIPLILGAMLGTTLTVQIIAFKVADYALIAVVVGVIIHIAGKYERSRQWSNIVLGIGLIFFGMAVMKNGVAPLRGDPAFTQFLHATVGNPWLSFLVATVFTAVVQASAATIALVLSFAGAGLLGGTPEEVLTVALPFVFGANVGTTVTALLASIHTGRGAFRCAVAHAVLKLVGAVVCMFLIGPIANATIYLTSLLWTGEASAERMVANSHTLFNLLNVIVYLPFVSVIAQIFVLIIPERPERTVFPELSVARKSSVDFLHEYHGLINALAQCVRMVRTLNSQLGEQFAAPDLTRLEVFASKDDLLDRGYREIRNHALLLYRLPSLKERSSSLVPIIRAGELIERLGDDFARSIVRSLRKLAREDLSLSVESCAELQSVTRKMSELLDKLATALETHDAAAVAALMELTKQLKLQIHSMRRSHFQALSDNVPSATKSSTYYLDILSEIESSTVKLKVLVKLLGRHFAENASLQTRSEPANVFRT